MNISIELLNFTYKEFIIIASILGENKILGMENPFSEYTDEGIIEEWRIIKEKLLKMNYIKVSGTKGIKIDKKVSSIVKKCCNCNAYAVIDRTFNNKSEQSHFYFSTDSIIELIETNRILYLSGNMMTIDSLVIDCLS